MASCHALMEKSLNKWPFDDKYPVEGSDIKPILCQCGISMILRVELRNNPPKTLTSPNTCAYVKLYPLERSS